MADYFKITPEQMRLWQFSARQNQTSRPESPLDVEADKLTLNDLYTKTSVKILFNELTFYVQIQKTSVGILNNVNYLFHGKSQQPGYTGILLFIKYYDPITATMEYLTTLTVESNTDKISHYIPHLLKMKDLPDKTNIEVYEEIKADMVVKLVTTQTFEQAELSNGDILCFQIVHPR